VDIKRAIQESDAKHRQSNSYICVAGPQAVLAKALLVQRVGSILRTRKLILREKRRNHRVPHPKLCNILRRQFSRVREVRFMDSLRQLGDNVQIIVKPVQRKPSVGSLAAAFE
jgi:Helix-turn-helix domain